MQKIRVFCSVVKTLNTSFCMKILFCKVTNITYKKLSASSRFDCPHSNTTHSFLTIGSGIKKGFSKSQSSTCFQLVFFSQTLLTSALVSANPAETQKNAEHFMVIKDYRTAAALCTAALWRLDADSCTELVVTILCQRAECLLRLVSNFFPV